MGHGSVAQIDGASALEPDGSSDAGQSFYGSNEESRHSAAAASSSSYLENVKLATTTPNATRPGTNARIPVSDARKNRTAKTPRLSGGNTQARAQCWKMLAALG